MILGENGVKMSKSLGNVVNPDEIIESHGADALRLYEMFMGPLDASLPWSNSGLDGAKRFLDRVDTLVATKKFVSSYEDSELDYLYHYTIKKVTADFEALKFNTAISQLMILLNELQKKETISLEVIKTYLILLNPICPHLTEELNESLGFKEILYDAVWPSYDETKLVLNEVTLAVQVNGKLRDTIKVPVDLEGPALEARVKALPTIQKYLENQEIRRFIVVQNKLVNLVIVPLKKQL
jgi:leucyl-tRNA synthetase